MNSIDQIFFFGCVQRAGHHMWAKNLQLVPASRCLDLFGERWHQVDGSFIPADPGVWTFGVTNFGGERSWAYLSAQDNTIDSRPGSHATFLLDAKLVSGVSDRPLFFIAVAQACINAFPKVAARVGLVQALEKAYGGRAQEAGSMPAEQVREIKHHNKNACNDSIKITCDARNPQNGNASHHYELTFDRTVGPGEPRVVTKLDFQDGPIAEVGTNGITCESLLAVVQDRLEGFQSSKWACRENAIALTKVQEALMWLEQRTRGRVARGVEGTHEV